MTMGPNMLQIYSNRRLAIFSVVNKVVLLVVIVWAFSGVGINFRDFIDGFPNAAKFVSRMIPPDFTNWRLFLGAALETIQMAVVGTCLAGILAFPLSFFGAKNINSNPWLYHLTRFLFDICRGISEIIWGLLFVSVVGLGPFAGILALTVHNTGALGRYFSETVESILPAILDAPKLAGATKAQTVFRMIVPEIRLRFIGYIFYYFEHGLRAATILGLVGAGGIGFLLETRISLFRYREVSALLIILLVIIVGVDRLSAIIRQNALSEGI